MCKLKRVCCCRNCVPALRDEGRVSVCMARGWRYRCEGGRYSGTGVPEGTASLRHCVQFSRLFNCTYKKFARKQP